ncbi:MAG TPA: nucleoside triphosphate pyrophosphohydrolase [Terriglobales bacterium]
MPTTGERFERAVAIMSRLRAPGGCPWDREQTFDSIKPYTLEETYEVFEAIDNRDWKELPGELGDLLLQVLFYAEMAKEDGNFSIDDVLDRLSDKLVGRHPHVFGDVREETSQEVLRNWETLKAEEKKVKEKQARENQPEEKTSRGAAENSAGEKPKSLLADVSSAMPALLEARKLSSRAAREGFDWPDVEGVVSKLHEEIEELREELAELPPAAMQRTEQRIAGSGRPEIPDSVREHLEEEVGDMMFALVNIARFLAVDTEGALKKTNRKFRQRFGHIEKELAKAGRQPRDASMEELESLWQEGKQWERSKN